MTVRLVSGYVPLKVNHRSSEVYHTLGKNLVDLPVDSSIYFDWIDDCWMYDALKGTNYRARTGGDPGKNTMEYHIVQHQKTAWLRRAAEENPDADVLVWMDYGIFHMEGFRQESVLAFLRDCERETEIVIPGSWPKGQDGGPCWRFNGSIIICHRAHVAAFDQTVRATAMEWAAETGTVIWEVNVWDRVEDLHTLPIRWYGATHNGSMLTEYRRFRNEHPAV